MARNSTEQRMSLGKLHVISNFSGIACELIYITLSAIHIDFGWTRLFLGFLGILFMLRLDLIKKEESVRRAVMCQLPYVLSC